MRECMRTKTSAKSDLWDHFLSISLHLHGHTHYQKLILRAYYKMEDESPHLQVKLPFLQCSGHFNCDTGVNVIILPLNELILGFNNFSNRRVKKGVPGGKTLTTLRIFSTKFHEFSRSNVFVPSWTEFYRNCNLLLTLQVQLPRHKIIGELSVIPGISCADELATKSVEKDSIVNLRWRTLSDKTYHRNSYPVHSLSCMLDRLSARNCNWRLSCTSRCKHCLQYWRWVFLYSCRGLLYMMDKELKSGKFRLWSN